MLENQPPRTDPKPGLGYNGTTVGGLPGARSLLTLHAALRQSTPEPTSRRMKGAGRRRNTAWAHPGRIPALWSSPNSDDPVWAKAPRGEKRAAGGRDGANVLGLAAICRVALRWGGKAADRAARSPPGVPAAMGPKRGDRPRSLNCFSSSIPRDDAPSTHHPATIRVSQSGCQSPLVW